MSIAAAQSRIRFGLGAALGQGSIDDPRAALKAQLAGPDPGLASALSGLPSGADAMAALHADVAARKALLQSGTKLAGNFKPQSRDLYLADGKAQLDWAVRTDAGFRERLVWFWTNHFTVSIDQGETAGLVGPFIREAIRPHVTGRFTDMVLAVERHPAMLRYLSNDSSVGPDSIAGQRSGRGLNENLGRESMELHTVGLAAGYSQTDVTNMAKILTGWSVAGPRQPGDATGFLFRPMAHEPGAQTVLGQSFAGGEDAGIAALTYLSQYPTTYRVLARKLVTHFVADTPPPDAVARIASVLQETGGDLAAASAALVDLPAAWIPLTKLKTPLEYVVSVLRVAPPPAGQPPVNDLGALKLLGQPLWGAPLPNGWPDQAADWDGSAAVMSRIDWGFTYAARFDNGDMGVQPAAFADAALGPLVRPATARAMAAAGSRREALAMLFAAPEFQRR
jgi:uncharacterized protein (DUF1800 family)